MESVYEIVPEENLFRKIHHGDITVDDEIAMLTAIYADPKFRKGMNALCDFNDATVNWSLEELDRFRNFVSRIKKTAGPCKWAIILPEGCDNTTARIFLALHKAFEDTIEAELFNDYDKASDWINQAEASNVNDTAD